MPEINDVAEILTRAVVLLVCHGAFLPTRGILSSSGSGSQRMRRRLGSGECTPYSATGVTLRPTSRAATGLSGMRRTAQVESHRIFERAFLLRQVERSGRMPEILESRQSPRLRFVGVDRQSLVVASTRMNHGIDAAAERALAPTIENVEGETDVEVDRR